MNYIKEPMCETFNSFLIHLDNIIQLRLLLKLRNFSNNSYLIVYTFLGAMGSEYSYKTLTVETLV